MQDCISFSLSLSLCHSLMMASVYRSSFACSLALSLFHSFLCPQTQRFDTRSHVIQSQDMPPRFSCVTVCVSKSAQHLNLAHVWLTALFVLIWMICWIQKHHVFLTSLNKCVQIARLSSAIARMTCELQWKAANIPDRQERKGKKRVIKKKSSRGIGKNARMQTVQIWMQLTPFQFWVVSVETSHCQKVDIL